MISYSIELVYIITYVDQRTRCGVETTNTSLEKEKRKEEDGTWNEVSVTNYDVEASPKNRFEFRAQN